MHGLFEPGNVELFISTGPPDRLIQTESLVGVSHDLPAGTHRITDRGKPAHVFGDMRFANLDLGPTKPAFLGPQCFLYQLGVLDVDPSPFGVVALNRISRAAGETMKGKTCLSAAQIPKRRVNRCQRDRGERTHRGRVNVKEQIAQNTLDIVRIAVEQAGNQMIVEKLDYGGSTGADGIAVACPGNAIGVGHAHDRRLLQLKALDRIRTFNLGRQIYLQNFNGYDLCHSRFPSPRTRAIVYRKAAPRQRVDSFSSTHENDREDRKSMPKVEVNGARLFYVLSGKTDAPVLMFSNSLGTTLDMWRPQLAAMESRFHLLRYDMRGHGQSDLVEEACSISILGQDVVALLDELRIDKVYFCGLSVGGVIGQWLGANAPDRLRSLVLCNTAAKIGTPEAWNKRIADVEQNGMASITEAVLDRWFAAAFRQ